MNCQSSLRIHSYFDEIRDQQQGRRMKNWRQFVLKINTISK